jgi:predicted component of type VI protein secretion system
MPARLVALDSEHTLLLDKPIVLIGRHDECDIQLESRKVSRRHCCIAQVDKHLVVRDLDSTNGIRINGTQVLEGTLGNGDELTIGNLRYQVVWEETDPGMAKGGQPNVLHTKPRSKPILIPPEALQSCDMPVPLREPADAPREHPAYRPPQPSPRTDPNEGTDPPAKR